MFFLGVLAFSLGIYLQALYRAPVVYVCAASALLLVATPFLFAHARRTACICLLFCFVLTGMTRLGTVREDPVAIYASQQLNRPEVPHVYEGIITEASPNVKILKLVSPRQLKGVRVILSSSENITINDRVTIHGRIKELTTNYKNPSLISSNWLRRLDGISHRLSGEITSVVRGTSITESWRRYLSHRIESSGAKHQGILKALTIGDTSGIDPGIKQTFSETGTSHILAISGSNIAIVTSFFFFLLRFLMRCSTVLKLRGDDRRYAALLTIPFVLFFMLTAGSGIPTIRATIMIIIYMLALFFGRARHLDNSLAVSALVILLVYPHSLFTPGFQLTFICVFSIVLFTRALLPFSRSWHPVFRWLFSSVVISLSAMIGTLPVILYHFHGFNPLTFLYNIFAVPLMCAAATPLAFVGMLAPFGEYLLRLSGETIAFTLSLLHHLNIAYLHPVVRPNLIETLMYFVMLIALFSVKARTARVLLFGIILPLTLIYASIAVHDRFFNRTMCVNVLDVGLGDAIFVEAPGGLRLLLDGGGVYSGDFDIGKYVVAPVILSRKVRTIDYVILTHPHKDHISGLSYILNNFDVRRLATTLNAGSNEEFSGLISIARTKGIPVEFWRKGDVVRLNVRTTLSVLHPPADMHTDNLNKSSLVLLLTHGSNSFLMAGDIDSAAEEQIIFSSSTIHADVLKVPHHGSRYSSSKSFVKAVDPALAILSVGPGITGIPSDQIIRRYAGSSIPLLRTDRDGMISLCSDGTRIRYRTFKTYTK